MGSIGTSVIKVTLGYYQGKPAMFLSGNRSDNGKRFIIKMDDIWKYSDTHNPMFEDFMANKMIQVCKLLDIDMPVDKDAFVRLMSNVSETIMQGIDDLVASKPYQEGVDDPALSIDDTSAADEAPEMKVRMM